MVMTTSVKKYRFERCETCEGKGKIVQLDKAGMDNVYFMECPDCGGQGRLAIKRDVAEVPVLIDPEVATTTVGVRPPDLADLQTLMRSYFSASWDAGHMSGGEKKLD